MTLEDLKRIVAARNTGRNNWVTFADACDDNIDALIEIAEAAERFYLSRAILENQKEVDWDAFENLGKTFSKLTSGREG